MVDERATRDQAAEVAQWLRRHPRFLEQFPDLAVTLVVPKDGGASASLAGYQLEVLRDRVRKIVDGSDPRAAWLRDLVVFEGYHEQLAAAVKPGVVVEFV